MIENAVLGIWGGMSKDKYQVIIKQNVPKVKKSQKRLQTPKSKEKLQTSQTESEMCQEIRKQVNKWMPRPRCGNEMPHRTPRHLNTLSSVGDRLGRVSRCGLLVGSVSLGEDFGILEDSHYFKSALLTTYLLKACDVDSDTVSTTMSVCCLLPLLCHHGL